MAWIDRSGGAARGTVAGPSGIGSAAGRESGRVPVHASSSPRPRGLRHRRSIRIEAEYAEETATAYRRQVWEYADVDVILLEGIFLLKRAFQPIYDLSVWIDCTFETALERAIRRGQEGLPPEATIRAYETIYFPAQRIHFERDDPARAASLSIPNDPRLDT